MNARHFNDERWLQDGVDEPSAFFVDHAEEILDFIAIKDHEVMLSPEGFSDLFGKFIEERPEDLERIALIEELDKPTGALPEGEIQADGKTASAVKFGALRVLGI